MAWHPRDRDRRTTSTRRAALGGAGLLLAGCRAGGVAGDLRVDGPSLLAGGGVARLRGVAVGDPLLVRASHPVSDYDRLAGTGGPTSCA